MLKRLSVVLLVLLVSLSAGLVFAFWDQLSQTKAEVINVGEGVVLEVDAVAEVPSGKFLVPAGVVLKEDDVEEVVLTYNVKLDQPAVGALNLAVVVESNVLVGGYATYADLVNINIELADPTVNEADVLVTVTVTLDQPTTEEIYDAIANKAISFTLTFTATKA